MRNDGIALKNKKSSNKCCKRLKEVMGWENWNSYCVELLTVVWHFSAFTTKILVPELKAGLKENAQRVFLCNVHCSCDYGCVPTAISPWQCDEQLLYICWHTHTQRHTGTPNCSAHNPNEWNAFPPENDDKTLQLTTTCCHIASSRGFENLHSFRFIPAFPFVIYDTSMQQGKENLKEHTIVAAWWCWVRNGMFHDVSEFRTGGHKKRDVAVEIRWIFAWIYHRK
jgi:hypothetical protein